MRRLGKLNVRIALGLAAPAVTEDGDTVDGAAGLEVCLQLLGRGSIVDVAHVDRATIAFCRVTNYQG